MPDALWKTQETSVRYEQRIEALTGVLRSLATFVVWAIAVFMILAAVGISLVLRLVVKTTPNEQWRVARSLRERIKDAFDEEGIEIPFPQQTVWHRGVEADR